MVLENLAVANFWTIKLIYLSGMAFVTWKIYQEAEKHINIISIFRWKPPKRPQLILRKDIELNGIALASSHLLNISVHRGSLMSYLITLTTETRPECFWKATHLSCSERNEYGSSCNKLGKRTTDSIAVCKSAVMWEDYRVFFKYFDYGRFNFQVPCVADICMHF
jgi:hypothetical protein